MGRPGRQRALLPGLVVAGVGVVAFAIGLVLFLPDDSGGPSSNPPSTRPQIMSTGELSDFQADLGHNVYWAGERSGTQVEVVKTLEGNVLLRYLTGGAEAGDPRTEFLTIGTYPYARAYARAIEQQREPGEVPVKAAGGATAFYAKKTPTSVYLAFPGQDLQIEVYDPDPDEARALVRSGDIVPLP